MSAHVYFARSAAGPIKIGYSRDVMARVAALSKIMQAPVDLMAYMPGSAKIEAYVHRLFREERIFSEWFSPSERLLSAIDEVKLGVCSFVPPSLLDAREAPSKVVPDETLTVCREYCVGIAGPLREGETVWDRIVRVSATSGVPVRTVKRIWYLEGSNTLSDVYIALKEAFEARMAAEW